jgi:chromosome segregation ATPase
MSRNLFIGTVSLAAIAAGVALLHAQSGEPNKPAPITIESPLEVEFVDVPVAKPEAVGSITVSPADVKSFTNVLTVKPEEANAVDLEIVNVDGEFTILAKPEVKDVELVDVQKFDLKVGDPAAREALMKVARDLDERARALRKEGKTAEADQAQHSALAIRRLIEIGAGIGEMRIEHEPYVSRQIIARVAKGPVAEELKKLEARLDELRAKLKEQAVAVAPNSELAERLKKEIQDVEKLLAEKRASGKLFQNLAVQIAPPLAGGPPGPPRKTSTRPALPGAVAKAQQYIAVQKHAASSPEVEALMHKADALRGAAANLKKAGLGEQAAALAEQAEHHQREAEKLRAQTQSRLTLFSAEHPPMELHRAINELREQVQAMRGEIGELRKRLEKK